jgi:hypothetical protein
MVANGAFAGHDVNCDKKKRKRKSAAAAAAARLHQSACVRVTNPLAHTRETWGHDPHKQRRFLRELGAQSTPACLCRTAVR